MSLFFPLSVGLEPTASAASGSFPWLPSMLCQLHAIPSISSYSASPFFQSLRKKPASAHFRKYAWTLLALPNSLGRAFHWMPVRRT